MEYPYNYYGGRGFRSCLDEALGAWEIRSNDNSETIIQNDGNTGLHEGDVAVVDYSTFKKELRKYSKRRTKLRRLMDGSDSKSLLADDVMSILRNDANDDFSRGSIAPSLSSDIGGCYLPMVNDDAEGLSRNCQQLPGLWNKTSKHKVVHRRWVLREVSNLERDGVELFLARETRKISKYYRSRIQLLSNQFVSWRTKLWKETEQHNGNNNTKDRTAGSGNDPPFELTRTMIQETIALGKGLLDLEAFCALNTLVVRQTLIRFDAFARSFEGTPLMEFYLKTVFQSTAQRNKRKKHKNTPDLCHFELRQILVHNEITTLCEDYYRFLLLMGQRNWYEAEPLSGGDVAFDARLGEGFHIIADRFKKDREGLRRLVLSSTIESATAVAAPVSKASSTTQPTVMQRLMEHILFGFYMEDQIGWYLDGMRDRGRSLAQEMKTLADWKGQVERRWALSSGGLVDALSSPDTAASCGMWGAILEGFECDNLAGCGGTEAEDDADGDDIEIIDSSKEDGTDTTVVTQQQKFNLFMALSGGFLYCMNYYIVEPSSTMYVNALGASDAAGATLIGMMPIASFLAAIVYSVWTNRVFRRPFLVSCTLMVTGNVVYSAAFNFKSLPMALIGRFLTGLGGPKMIVRRYMADTTTVGIRTTVNALFGMVVAAGSALGPGCAILLSNFEFIVPLPGGSELWFNSMTGPGWFMAVLWFFFSAALFLGFREQERIGLTEKLEQDLAERKLDEELCQKQREQVPKRIEEGAPQNHSASGGMASTRTNHRNGATVTYSIPTIKQSSSTTSKLKPNMSIGDESMRTILTIKSSMSMTSECYPEQSVTKPHRYGLEEDDAEKSLWAELQNVSKHMHFPVRICMGLLFAKVFVIETLVSCTSVLSKNRYGWTIKEVGMLGCANGFFVIPLSILVGKLSLRYQDRYLMMWLLAVGMAGLCLLVDGTDILDTSDSPRTYNKNSVWSVHPIRYVMGYFVTYISIQSFEGIIGSALSKLIPTALAQGTFNSGLLATLVDTLGRSCGDLFISLVGFWNIRQLMNGLFVPGVLILATCLIIVRRYYDLLAV